MAAGAAVIVVTPYGRIAVTDKAFSRYRKHFDRSAVIGEIAEDMRQAEARSSRPAWMAERPGDPAGVSWLVTQRWVAPLHPSLSRDPLVVPADLVLVTFIPRRRRDKRTIRWWRAQAAEDALVAAVAA